MRQEALQGHWPKHGEWQVGQKGPFVLCRSIKSIKQSSNVSAVEVVRMAAGTVWQALHTVLISNMQ